MNAVERGDFIAHVDRATRWLPSNDPWRVGVVRGRSGAAIADLLDEDPLLDAKVFEKAVQGELVGHRSEALALAQGIAPLFRAHREEDVRLRRLERHFETQLGELLLTVGQRDPGSDATGTLRLSDGTVSGYRSADRLLAHRTTFHGLIERSLVFDGQAPFALGPAWQDLESRKLLATTLNVASSNDIAFGNSGSPLVNRDLQLVGVVFDGNRPTLANRHLFLDDTPRTISVSTDAILVTLREVLHAEALLVELIGQD